MRYISDRAVSTGVFRDRHGEPLAASLVRPSELLGTVKKHHHHVSGGDGESGSRNGRCQCRHHREKQRQVLEERRRQLKQRLAAHGDSRKLAAIDRHTRHPGSEELNDIDSLDGGLPSNRSLLGLQPEPPQVGFEPGTETLQVTEESHVAKGDGGGPRGGEDSSPKVATAAAGGGGGAGGGSSYAKGPAAKHKRHRKLNKEQPLVESSEEDEVASPSTSDQVVPPPPPPASSPPPASAGQASNPSPMSHRNHHHHHHHHGAAGAAASAAGSHRQSKSGSASRAGSSRGWDEVCNPFSGSLWEKREPFSHLWVTLSSMYGKLLVLLMLAFCLTEVMDNQIRPLAFQGFFMMYLYVGSIVAIMCIYATVLLDNCPGFARGGHGGPAAGGGDTLARPGNLYNKTYDPESGSVLSFGTLRRAHIDKTKVSRTSFYLRVGALVFGLGTLIFTGLEIAMHATMETTCVDDILVAHPVLQALFTFLQMHFLFVNSQVIVERFSLLARFGFVHLVATNLCVWVRTVVWESANDWIHHVYRQQQHHQLQQQQHLDTSRTYLSAVTSLRDVPIALGLRSGSYYGPYNSNYFSDRSFTNVDTDPYQVLVESNTQLSPAEAIANTYCNGSIPISREHLSYVISLYECFNNNTLGKLWTSSMPYLFPFIVEYRIKIELHFSLIAAAVTYIMWSHVGDDRISGMEKDAAAAAAEAAGTASAKKLKDESGRNTLLKKGLSVYWRVDCQSASKGLFLGLLCLVGGIIILIIFFVMKDTSEFRDEMFWIFSSAELSILALCVVGCIGGFVQVQKLSPRSFRRPYDLDELLSGASVIGAYVYAIFSMIAAGVNFSSGDGGFDQNRNIVVFSLHALLLVQVTMQGLIISESGRRSCSTRIQQLSKPGRQLITFLLFANITLWILDTFMTHSWITQQLQLEFYGLLTWGILSRISLPLLIFYRFHSCVVLVEIWKNTYRTKEPI